jgi:hypothetical protein
MRGDDAPIAKPSTPVAKPRVPEAKPATPIAKPSTPVARPRVPEATPSTPVAKPVTPIRGDDAPIAKPRVPEAKPSTPIAKPTNPVAKPVTPIRGDDAPVAKPRVPEAKPSTPIAKPRVPEAKPSTPVAKPVTPIRGDDAPIAKPTKPTESPTRPLPTKPIDRGSGATTSTKGEIPAQPTTRNPTRTPPKEPPTPIGAGGGDTIGGADTPRGAGPSGELDPPTTALPRRPAQFVENEVYGVPVGNAPTGGPLVHGGGTAVVNNGSGNTTVVNNTVYNNYNQYISNVSHANGWYSGGAWSSCGPCPVWQPYQCSDGLSVSVGFGSGGFSFGFFYGSSCAPLCSSWCNPWWDGYASYWTCNPYYGSAACVPWRTRWYARWNPCWGYAYDPCWTGWNCWPRPVWATTCWSPCAWPAYTPCYTYAPVVCATIVTAPVVVTTAAPVVPVAAPVVVPPPALPNPDALWTFLAEGYDDDAERGFVELAIAAPGESAWRYGQGFARAFRGETAWAADKLREAMYLDPSGVERTSADPRYLARLDALERSLSPIASGPTPSVDALLVIAASQAGRGDLAGAYFTATTARAEGDRTAGTAAFIAWLEDRLRQRI